jgi:hypothetical protein
MRTGQRLRVDYVPIDKLKGWPRNPHKICPQQREALARNLPRYGFVDPTIVNRNLTILGGHQRLAVEGIWNQAGPWSASRSPTRKTSPRSTSP